MSGNAERIGLAGGFVDFQVGEKTERIDKDFSNTEIVLSVVLGKIEASGFSLEDIKKIGHRVVHGGEKFFEPIEVNPSVVTELEKLNELAMLHNPPNIAGIKGCLKLLPNAKNYAVFDTAFHQRMPKKSYLYGIPYSLYTQYKIRRYGFHGSSHRFVADRAAAFLKRSLSSLKIVTIHLGNGCSMAAVDGGVSLDTSMGFTPLEGLLMGTRSGDIDPSVILYIMGKEGLTLSEANTLLNKHSGLQGISGVSSDMREVITEMKSGNKQATYAFDVFTYRVKKYIGAYAAALGGLDAVVFTGGIGENSADVRRACCTGLEFMGILFDESSNSSKLKEKMISTETSKTKVLVIPTNEELVIAMDSMEIVNAIKPIGANATAS